ncbi:MAG TPA: tetratricopeptide repeat protein [Spirochaetia bacterium]|jgi:tetratricopeptide (TPR) repeat protein|nr:tetratricopeptide repeat protein [Spirochaetia bacterium]
MKKWGYVLLTVALVSVSAFCDDKSTYEQLLQARNYPDLLKHLQNWEKKEPKNPEVYIGYFNYYLSVGSKEAVSIDKTAKKNTDVLSITDPKTGEVVGYINPATAYDPENTKQAILKLNEGLRYGQDRLDMYFGKIYILNEVYDFKTAGDVLVQVLNRSKINGNQWLWSNNEPVEDGKAFLLNNIQDYYSLWLGLESEEGMAIVRQVGEVQIELYPEDIYAYNNVAASYGIMKDYTSALQYFLKAEQIDPEDVVVLNNIAYTYVKLGDKAKAKEYYTKMIEYGTDEEKKYAEAKLKEL